MTLAKGKPFEPMIPAPTEIELSPNGRQVLERRYLRRGLDGKPAETVEEMFRRVARAVAAPDAAYGYDVQSTEEAFYGLLTSRRFFPNSPTFTGAGTPLGQLAACFVLPISDDLGKQSDGIFQTLRDAALIQQTGGGNGFSFSRLRPKGDKVASSAGVATGPVGFLRVYDTAFGEVAQGGSRRGANMAVLRVDHPDIEEFIACKAQEGQITNFNISVGITDAFMQAVEEDADFPLVNPRDGTVWRTVRARALFDKMVTFAHHNGEPGALFLDAANRSNPVPHLYKLEATNPCGEQWLGPYENCCLGSINLAQHVTADGRVDWDKLRESTIAATRFLDNVVDANKYVPAVPQLREAALRARRIGLGIMGLGDIMYALGVRYGSEEGQEFAAQIMEFIRYHCMVTSIELARERGPFPAIQGSIYDPNDLKWRPPTPLTPYRRDWGRPAVDWEQVVAGIRQHGIRNAAQTTVAPTGCLVPGSMVTSDLGVLPIEQLGNTRGPQWQDVTFNVSSEDGEHPATQFYINGKAHTLRVVTRRGYTLQGTDYHRIRVLENNVWVWRRLDELKPGDWVPLKSTGLIGRPRRVELDTHLVTDLHATPVTLPQEMTTELAYLIGFFMGDGSLKTRSLRFAVSDAASEERLIKFTERVFGLHPTVTTAQRSPGLKSLEIHSLNVVEFWKTNGFAKTQPANGHSGKGYLPHIPLAILRTNDAEIYGAFLAGLFDADGTMSNDRLLTWTTAHQPFHDQVKTLLFALGILTTSDVQQSGFGQAPLYRLRVAHVQAAERLALALPYLARFSATETARRKTLGDMIPISRQDYEFTLAIAEPGQEKYRVWGWRQRDYLVSRASLAGFVEHHHEELQASGFEHLVEAAKDDIYYDQVATIEDGGWQETYDISVPGTHAYVANGFVSHNTIGTVTGCEGYGCEPVFALAYTRTVKDGDKDLKLTYTSPLFEKALRKAGLDDATRQRISEQVSVTGSCQDVLEVPETIRRVFVVASDITAEEHVRMQAAIQAFVDNSISKCVVGHTLLLTDQGLAPIETLSDLRLPDQFAPLACNVLTPKGVEPATLFYYGGHRETRKVTLEYGFEIEGTPNHRIHVLTEEGEIAFRRLDELRPGDIVVLYSGQQQFGRPTSLLPPFSGRFRTDSHRLTFPERMSTELAFLLGCITSEGAITVNGVTISSTDVALLEQLQGIARNLFGLDSYIASDTRNQVRYLQLNSRALRDWLLTDLDLQAGAEHKVIPPCILRASQEEIAAFLRGLFLDGFMTQNGKLFGITLTSRRLIAQLQVLLLNAGIVATTRQVGERAYSLTVQGGELEQLADWIGFVEVWKNERIERRNLGRLQRYHNYSRLLPKMVTDALAEMKSQVSVSLRAAYNVEEHADFQAYQRARVNLLSGHRLERQDARRLYETLRRAGGRQDFADRFFDHDDEQKVYASVEKVEAGFAEVFDISVPESHVFVANGVANHNTINFPSTATVEDVATAYKLAWKLGCKGLTVYVAGSRQEVVLETKAISVQKEKGVPAAEGQRPATAEPRPAAVPAEPAYPAQRRPRPAALPGMTYRKETPLGTAYITVNVNGHAQPFEVFLNVGKAGSDVASVSEALGRLISLVLRLPSPLEPLERLKLIIDQLAGIGGGRTLGFGVHRVRSLPDAIAQVLREHLNGHFETLGQMAEASEPAAGQLALPIADRPIGDLCPDCGQAAFIATEGCRKCYVCGYSEC